MNTLSDDSFTDYLTTRKESSDAFVCGDVEPLFAVSSHLDPVSIFGPSGSVVSGADDVDAVNAEGAASFAPGSTNDFDEVQSAASGDLAFWAGVQRSEVRVKGQDAPVPMALRVSEVYRRENGEWKLVHRHADQLAED